MTSGPNYLLPLWTQLLLNLLAVYVCMCLYLLFLIRRGEEDATSTKITLNKWDITEMLQCSFKQILWPNQEKSKSEFLWGSSCLYLYWLQQQTGAQEAEEAGDEPHHSHVLTEAATSPNTNTTGQSDPGPTAPQGGTTTPWRKPPWTTHICHNCREEGKYWTLKIYCLKSKTFVI